MKQLVESCFVRGFQGVCSEPSNTEVVEQCLSLGAELLELL
jgi:hypothetical protein